MTHVDHKSDMAIVLAAARAYTKTALWPVSRPSHWLRPKVSLDVLGWVLIALLPLVPGNALVAGAPAELDRSSPRVVAPLPADVPTPTDNPTIPQKVHLGKQLFFDVRLSGDNTTSCATCHVPEKAFSDGRARAQGSGGSELARNTPTLLNVGFLETLFWDGRATSLEQQALAPIEARNEMNQDLEELERELNAVPGYLQQFQEVFGAPATRQTIAQALAAFQRTLVTGPSPFDRYLAGDKSALSPRAKRGMELFMGEAGCISCHRGPLLSDGKFYRLGIGRHDRGRGAVTGQQSDDYRFRVPPLRNVAQTDPYMHDGSLATLDDVVMFYYREMPTTTLDGMPLDAQPLLGNSFSDIPDVVAFLESLSGEPPDIEPPELPD